MTNQDNPQTQPRTQRTRLKPGQLVTAQLFISLILFMVALVFLFPSIRIAQAQVILAAVAGMFITSALGYMLIRREQTIPGLGLTIYGFGFSLFLISAIVERIGIFAGLLIVMLTVLSVSVGISSRRVIEAIAVSFILGAGSLILDLYTRGFSYRISISDQLETVFAVFTIGILIVILFFIIQQFQWFSLRVKLISAFLIGSLVALALLGYFNNRSVRQVLIQEANQSLFDAATLTETSLRQFINFNLESIRTEANLPVFVRYLSSPASDRASHTDDVAATLRALAWQQTEYLASYALLDLQGNVLIDTENEHAGTSEAEMFAFSEPIEQGTSVMSPVVIDPFTNQPSIYFSSPVVENGSTILGVLRMRYHADVLQQLIASNNMRGGEGSFAVLFDEHFIHLAHGIAPETIFTTVVPLDDAEFQQLLDMRRLPQQSTAETFLDLPDLAENLAEARDSSNGVKFFESTDIATGELVNRVVVLDMGEPSWLLAFFQPREIFLAPNEQIQKNTVTISLLSMGGAVALAFILTQILVSPILDLTEKANQLAKGKLNTRVEVTTEDEIGELGQSFNSMAYQLQSLVNSLESQVISRTKQLENRAAQLQASAEVARDATSEQSLQQMLDRAATLIHDRFGYYHVGVYLKDNAGENVLLTATTDEPGKKLLEIDHQYSIDPETNVGYACILGEAIIATTDDATPALNFHPMLVGSQSQLVLPLNLGKETIGVIDLHSTNPIAFSNEEDKIFQTLADQLAIAVEKTKFQEEIQKTLSELETAYGAFTHTAWQRFIQTRQNISGYRYNPSKKVEAVSQPPEEVLQAWEHGERVNQQRVNPGSKQPTTLLAIPIKVRGTVIGVLDVEFETSKIPADTTNLINEISDRLSLILENARLIETAQRQVQRERLTSEITNSIRQSLDLDLVLRTAVQEIGEKLGLTEVELRISDQEQAMMDGIRPTGSRKTNGSQPESSEDVE